MAHSWVPFSNMFGLITFDVLVWAAWVGAGAWALLALITLHRLRRQQRLGPAPRTKEAPLPAQLVSILVPARNEEGRVLSQAIRSMLAQDYRPFEVIAVNDRSTDATGAILRAIAKAEDKLIVVDGTETPAGWLGKPHALQQALDVARGEWVLATDADMIFHEAALRTTMEFAIAGSYDAVTLVPRIETRTFWERLFAPIFGWFMAIGMPIERINNPRRRDAVAVGGFFLIHREELARVGDYHAVKAEVAEDMRMAQLLKQSGSRLRIEYAPDLASTRMYDGFAEIWEGFTKNFFAGMQFSLLKTIASTIAVLFCMIAPLVVAIVSAIAWTSGSQGRWLDLLLATATIWLMQVLTFSAVNSYAEVPIFYSLTVSLGFLLFVAILINSTFRIASGRGVVWKGRKIYDRASAIYPSRPGQRSRRPATDD
ncbi:MAG: hypothetical protein QOJ64_433 [Acidobacteriota bacterium]|nr:hypothetical protein [Acidobacteriota bacterium]